MRAVAFRKPLPISEPEALVDVEIETPTPGPRDLLVKVEAVSVNPVDFKVRRSNDPGRHAARSRLRCGRHGRRGRRGR